MPNLSIQGLPPGTSVIVIRMGQAENHISMDMPPGGISLEFQVVAGHYRIVASHMEFMSTEVIIQVRDQHMTVAMAMAPDEAAHTTSMQPRDLFNCPIERTSVHIGDTYDAVQDQYYIDLTMNYRITVGRERLASTNTTMENLMMLLRTQHIDHPLPEEQAVWVDLIITEDMRQRNDDWDGAMPDPEARSERSRQMTALQATDRALGELGRQAVLTTAQMQRLGRILTGTGVTLDDIRDGLIGVDLDSTRPREPTASEAHSRPIGKRHIEL